MSVARIASVAALIFATTVGPAHALQIGTIGIGSGTAHETTGSSENTVLWDIDWSPFGDSNAEMWLSIVVKGNDFLNGPWPDFRSPSEGFRWERTSISHPDSNSTYIQLHLFAFNRTAKEYLVWLNAGGGAATIVDWTIDYTLAVSPVPIPAAGVLFASAMGLASLIRRRRNV